MPEEEEDDDKKAKGGKKDDKKADKGGGKDKGGAKDKGGGKDKGGKDKGGKDKGGKDKSDSKSGSGKASKTGSTEGAGAGKDKGGKDKDKGDKPEAIKSPQEEAPKDKKPEGEAKPDKGGEQKADKSGEKKPEEAKKEAGGGPKPGEPAPGAKKSVSATSAGSKEKVKKHDASEKTEKSSDKSSIKSATSVEKTATSKTESTEKSSASATSEAENVLQKVSKKSSKKTLKGGAESSSRTVVRTVTARGPVYAEHYYDEDTDEDGSRNYIEIQMFGRRHSADQINQASRGWAPGTSAGTWNQNQYWNQDYYDLPSQQPQLYEPSVTRTTAVVTGYGSEMAGTCRDPYGNYGDLTVSVWQPPPPQQPQVDFARDQMVVQVSSPPTPSRELKATTHMDAGRNAAIAQRLKGMHQGLMKPLPDDVVTSTERIIYEVTRGRSSNPTMESLGGPASRVSSGGLVRSGQAMGQFCNPPPSVGQAVVRHEMRQSSATRIQTLGPGGQIRTTSNQGMICSMAPPKQGSGHSFRTVINQGMPPGPMAVPQPPAPLPVPMQPQPMDIINQQANIINQQSNIINQQSNIIDQQLNMMGALKSRSARFQQQQPEEIQQGYQVMQQELALPALPNAQMDGLYNNDVFLSAEVIETNRMPRSQWNHRH